MGGVGLVPLDAAATSELFYRTRAALRPLLSALSTYTTHFKLHNMRLSALQAKSGSSENISSILAESCHQAGRLACITEEESSTPLDRLIGLAIVVIALGAHATIFGWCLFRRRQRLSNFSTQEARTIDHPDISVTLGGSDSSVTPTKDMPATQS